MGSFRFVGSHADTLDNGQPVEPGQFVELSGDDAGANQGLIDDGLLVAVTPSPEKSSSKAKSKEGGEG